MSEVAPGEFVLMGMPDVHGSVRGKALRPDAFESAVARGAVMTDLLLALDPTDTPITAYDGFGLRTGAGDLIVHPESSTLREMDWMPGWRICLCTPVWADGRPCELSSRETLRGVLAQMTDLGYETRAAFEYEVRLRDGEGQPLSSGLSYSLGEVARFERFVQRLLPALQGLGVELSAVHTEAGPGLLELNIAAREGLRAADDAVYTKLAVKEVAASIGMQASFMAKTKPGEEGSSGHVHLSCWANGANVFAASDGAADSASERVRGCDRRRARPPAGRVADAQPDDQLLQAPRSGLVRSRQRQLGTREPLLRSSRHPRRGSRPLADRVPTAGRRRQSISGSGRARPPPRSTGCGGVPRRESRSWATPPSAQTSRHFPARWRVRCGRSMTIRYSARRLVRRSATTTGSRASGSYRPGAKP